jgi:hypothetical protein
VGAIRAYKTTDPSTQVRVRSKLSRRIDVRAKTDFVPQPKYRTVRTQPKNSSGPDLVVPAATTGAGAAARAAA